MQLSAGNILCKASMSSGNVAGSIIEGTLHYPQCNLSALNTALNEHRALQWDNGYTKTVATVARHNQTQVRAPGHYLLCNNNRKLSPRSIGEGAKCCPNMASEVTLFALAPCGVKSQACMDTPPWASFQRNLKSRNKI